MAKKTITSGTTQKFLEDINANFAELYELAKKITFGTEEPNNANGEDGDIYIQYEEPVS